MKNAVGWGNEIRQRNKNNVAAHTSSGSMHLNLQHCDIKTRILYLLRPVICTSSNPQAGKAPGSSGWGGDGDGDGVVHEESIAEACSTCLKLKSQ